MPSKVSLVKTTDHFQGTLDALENIKDTFLPKLLSSKEIVVKINFVAAIRELATTPSQSVAAFCDFARSNGYNGRIIIAETAVMGSAPIGFKMHGFNKIAKKYDVELFDLSKDDDIEMEIVDHEGDPVVVPYSKTIKETDFLVSMTRPKTHDTVVATLTIKNLAVGGLIRSRSRVHAGKNIHPNLVKILKMRVPDLGVLDGVVGMEGNGPISGSAIESNWAAASTDVLAIDTLALYLMGLDIENVGYLYMLKEEGFGNVYPNGDVEIVGADPKELVKPFQTHNSYSRQINWR